MVKRLLVHIVESQQTRSNISTFSCLNLTLIRRQTERTEVQCKFRRKERCRYDAVSHEIVRHLFLVPFCVPTYDFCRLPYAWAFI
jgi:hypothetical protein